MKFLAATILSTAAVVLAAPTPPGIPTESSAKTQLNGLTVATPSDSSTYDRDLFPHWEIVDGKCDAREYVLKRDGTNVETDTSCHATSGNWVSPYDDEKYTDAGDLDIDHMVPLANAWISGASEWTTAQREAFANDIERPQLWAVNLSQNRSKGDQSPDEWKPALASFYCTYAESWVAVKSHYDLTITTAEKSALSDMLATC